MAEYIEREALLERNMYGNTNPITHRTYAKNLIESAPTADVVEVVRCKDCLFSYKEPDYEYGYMCYKGVYHPSIGETRHRKLVQDIDFCSHGKRKEGAEKYVLDTAVVEAVKEFAERLIKEAENVGIDREGDFLYSDSDNTTFEIYDTVAEWCEEVAHAILKEMVGDAE